MDPLTLLFGALVAGASAALKTTADEAVKDAYAGLKALIKRKWGGVGLEPIERDPASTTRQTILREDLQAQGDLADAEVLEKARALLAAIEKHDAAAGEAAGITIEDIRAGANANIRDLVAEGSIGVKGVTAENDVNITGLRSGRAGAPPPNPTRR